MQHPSTAGRSPRDTRFKMEPNLKTQLDDLDDEYEDINYNARRVTNNLERDVKRMRAIND